jgi:DNA-binding NarL/FixJ family response regulator
MLADDETRVRFALRVLLSRQAGVEVAGEAVNAAGLLALLAQGSPDLLLLDWELPDVAGAPLVAAVRGLCPRLPIIVLSGRPDVRRAALAAGADAFVSKADPPERLLAALAAQCPVPPLSRPGLSCAAC